MAKRKQIIIGFSLVELMAAIAIVSILVALALPRYRAFIARSRMAEAKTNLGILATLSQSYQIEYGTSPPSLDMGGIWRGAATACDSSGGTSLKNGLGFRVTNCRNLRYRYTGYTSFNANARVDYIYPSCPSSQGEDNWRINQQRVLTHHDTNNAIKLCSN